MTNVNVKEDISDWIFPIKERFTLSDSFLEKYKDKQPNWGPLGYVIYKRSYSRLIPGEDRSEEWVDTCKRVVEGSYTVQLNHCKSLKLFWDQRKAQYSAQKMFDKMFNLKFCPAGRGLYCMGTDLIYKRGSAGLFNCSTISTKNIKTNFSNPFAFMMDFGMYGVGIGFDTKGANTVTIKEPSIGDYTFTVDDSRQGWVELLRVILDSYVGKTKYPKNIDYSKIRPEGSPIVTSGGIAPGPKCLIDCIESITKILNSRINEKLTSGNITDIMNIIGKCVISGGKRRIAQIAFGDYSDEEYISLKDPVKYEKELLEYRWASNNSVFAEIGMDYNKTIDKTITNGEPGYIYLDALKNYGRFKDGRQENIDADVDMTNPCYVGNTLIAVADGRNAISIKQLTEEGKDVPVYSINPEGKVEIKMGRNPRITGYDKELLEVVLDDNNSIKVTPNHKFILKDGTVKEAKDLKIGDSLQRFQKTFESFKKGGKKYIRVLTDIYNKDKRDVEHRLIYKFYKKDEWDEKYKKEKSNGWNTGGIVIHHKDYNSQNNSINNLELMTFKEHSKFHGEIDQSGKNNGMYGKKHSEKTKKLIGTKAKKRFESEEYKNKMSIALKKAMNNKETKNKLSKIAKNRWLKIYKDIEENGLCDVNIKNGRLYIIKKCERRDCNNKFELPYDKRNKIKYCSNKCRFLYNKYNIKNINIETSIKNIQEYNKKKFQEFEKNTDLETIWINDRLYVKKICEAYDCNNEIILPIGKREICFCSRSCGNKTKKGIENRRLGQKKKFEETSLKTKHEQIRVFKDLEKLLGRIPFKKEWENECKSQNITIRFNPKSNNPNILNGYKELKKEAEVYNHRVKEVRKLDYRENVYNITVDDNHTIGIVTSIKQNSVNGIFTLQCGEIGLSGGSAGYGGELCNLSEVFPSNHENIDEFKDTLKYAYLYCKSVTLIPTHNEETNALILKNRRIGISQSGVTNAIEKLGIHEYFKWCDQGYQYIKEMDVKYSNWLCIPKSIKLTTTKPSGCRTKDSLTILDSGIFTLEELLKDHPKNNEWNLIEDKNLYVLQDNKKNKITKTYRNGLSDIYKIKLRYNYELECTPNHKWFVKENHSNKHQNKNEIKKINDWIRTDELKPGYVLDVNMNSYNNDNSYKFKKIETPKTIFRKNDNNINQPDEMNCDIAWFLGYLWGDGCFSPTKFRIRFMDQYIFNLEKIQRIMKEQFNLDKKIHKSSGDRDASVYEVGSVMLWNWLKENDIWKYKYENYIENRCLSDIPKCVRYSKKEHILSFIAGLIDSDGCISVSNKNKLLAQITTSYDEFAKHLQQVCFSVGICIGRSHNTKGYNHQCNNNKKSIWLMSINQNTDKKSFYVLLKNSNKMTKYNNEYKELEWTCLGNSGHKYKLGKIISVEKLEDKKETFDIEVENEHWYYSGGIKSHNTVSLLPGVNPGIHYAHSEYYIRRVRIEEKNPLIKILKKSGYKIEPSVYGDNTMVVEFPIKSENFLKSKFDVSVWEQMQLMTMVQHYWSDNSVSSTITFKEEEKKDLKTILEMYEDKIKTVSFLPLDVKSYQQMPYETITKEQYEDMIKNIKPMEFNNISNTHDSSAEEKFCNSETCELQVK